MKSFLNVFIGLLAFIAVVTAGLFYMSFQMRLHSVVLTSKSCAPPCGYGITPGKITPDEAFAVLANQPWVTSDTLEMVSPQKGTLIWVSQTVDQRTTSIEIKGNTPVARIEYFDPGLFEQVFAQTILLTGWGERGDLSQLKP